MSCRMRLLIAFVASVMALAPDGALADPTPPRIESVVPSARQPFAADPAVIFYDNFDAGDEGMARYLEPKAGSPDARFSEAHALGGAGKSMECVYPAGKGQFGHGNRKVVFGDSPVGKPHRRGERFEDVYWRVYVKHPAGWQGDPAKMSRAIGFVSHKWDQAFILHVWGGGNGVLTLDPATGVRNGQIVTTRYNDFAKLKWLGNSPKGKFPVHATDQAGRWVCVEARMKLNTPGKKDGVATLWVDGRLDCERSNVDFRGTWADRGINAVFLEAYWNDGSPVDQSRWYDEFVVSTEPIGPVVAAANPTLIKTPAADAQAWAVEIASDADGKQVVWSSKPAAVTMPSSKLTVDANTGAFAGALAGKTSLAPGATYFCRARQQDKAGAWSAWGEWHQPFAVER